MCVPWQFQKGVHIKDTICILFDTPFFFLIWKFYRHVLQCFSIDMTEDSRSDILIPGAAGRNRGIHGDLVAVEILPRSEWKGRSLVIHEAAQGRYFKDYCSYSIILPGKWHIWKYFIHISLSQGNIATKKTMQISHFVNPFGECQKICSQKCGSVICDR